MGLTSGVYTGTLMHARRTPREHAFRYAVQYYLLDLDELPQLARSIPLFSVNRWNVISFDDRDHFGEPGRSTKESVLAFCGLEAGRVLALTQLRVLGYVFNPVTYFWVYREGGGLAAIVSEINNTFGERLPELLSPANQVEGRPGELTYEHDKHLHVSPFFGLDQRYRYAVSEPGARILVRMDVGDATGTPFRATLSLRRRADLTGASFAWALVRYPLMPVRVIAAIHWQALRLWLKRVPFHHKPPFLPGTGSARPT